MRSRCNGAKWTDPNRRHVRVYVELLNTPAWRVLGFSAKAFFLDLRASVTATNNGNITATLAEMKHKGWTAPTTLAKALYELRARLHRRHRGGWIAAKKPHSESLSLLRPRRVRAA